MVRVKIFKHGEPYGFFECEADQVQHEIDARQVPAWGKPERWVREGEEDISGAIETRQVEILPGMPEVVNEEGEVIPEVPPTFITEYKLPAEFTIVEEDMTQEIAEREAREKARREREKRKARMDFAKDFFAVMGEINDVKGLELVDFMSLLSDQRIQAIKALVETGALVSARALLSAYPVGVYTEQELGKLIAEIDEYLAREAAETVS